MCADCKLVVDIIDMEGITVISSDVMPTWFDISVILIGILVTELLLIGGALGGDVT